MQAKKDDFEPTVGETYGYIKVVFGPFSTNGARHWVCECKCGKQIARDLEGLRNAVRTKKGGCLPCSKKSDRVIDRPTYAAYYQLRDKCTNPKSEQFKNYGAAGLKLCERWQNSFEEFLKDVGVRPGPGYVLARKNDDPVFSAENTKWMTRAEYSQARAEAAKKVQISDSAFKVRILLEREAKKCKISIGELFHLASLVPAMNLSVSDRGFGAELEEYKDHTIGGYLKMISAPEAMDMATLATLGKRVAKAAAGQKIPEKKVKGRVVYPKFLIEQEYFKFINDVGSTVQTLPVVIESAAKSEVEPVESSAPDNAASIEAFFNT